MSKLLISQYYNEVDKIISYGGSKKEISIRVAFQNLLNSYCQTKNFLLIPELDYQTKAGKIVYPDGTIKDALRLDWGYWESKDQDDNLEREIEKKLAKGYPDDNILFEDSHTAILIQNGQETMRVSIRNSEDLDKIINSFINYTRPEVKDFREAIDSFKEDLPTILDTLRKLLNKQIVETLHATSLQLKTAQLTEFQQRFNALLKLCQESINPNINSEDIREMMIQHILTEDIFLHIFNESQFHRENNIARSLQGVIDTFFTGKIKRQTLSSIDRYYNVIRRMAANIVNHHEKQKFLKAVYENFYKAYNPLAADRLGIVYTPNEIVKFMIESTDYLVHKHFNKLLADPQVEILDPATGTGTFITELIEYLPSQGRETAPLRYKYQNEIHCNELAILPYYIANLNIEYTYRQKMGEYQEFNNIYLVDTLDPNSFDLKQQELFAMSLKNTERMKRQNDRKISVIIGNPPYNANQQNENNNNKNREYPAIDQRIKDTYVKESSAQKTKVYDMYSRFFRWASDRISDKGIIAFITNSSFIDAKTFDGFRKVVKEEFDYIYILDLGGNIRAGDKTGNVFNIMVGVAISFLVKKASKNKLPCQIMYFTPQNLNSGQEKLDFIAKNKFDSLNFEHIIPDQNNNWINLTDNDFDSLLPLANKETKLAKKISEQKAIFKLFSLGLATNRDEWVYDFNERNLTNKIKYFCDTYKKEQQRWFSSNQKIKINDFVERKIKWTSELEQHLIKGSLLDFKEDLMIKSIYRPFVSKNLYFDRIIVHRIYQQDSFFPMGKNKNNIIIAISGNSSSKNFQCLATKTIVGLDFLEKTQCLPLYIYDEEGNKQENITDWGLKQFREYYSVGANGRSPLQELITKEDIFYYIYGVLHNPKYREKYELNLKREFPRIPFYNNFNQWKNWGQKLMDLHLNYETITPYPLTIINVGVKGRSPLQTKPKLKADKTKNQIIIDEITTLTEIPSEVWEYKLGNRSAIEWILDQYKEKKPKDQTIAEKFNNYQFSDYKEEVIDLLKRVTTVSLETMKIIKKMD